MIFFSDPHNTAYCLHLRRLIEVGSTASSNITCCQLALHAALSYTFGPCPQSPSPSGPASNSIPVTEMHSFWSYYNFCEHVSSCDCDTATGLTNVPEFQGHDVPEIFDLSLKIVFLNNFIYIVLDKKNLYCLSWNLFFAYISYMCSW